MRPSVPLTWHSAPEHLRLLAAAINDILIGRGNATGTLTIAASVGTTTLTDLRIGPDTCIALMPTTANAAAALATTYVTSRGNGTATVTHANNAQTDRTYVYSLVTP